MPISERERPARGDGLSTWTRVGIGVVALFAFGTLVDDEPSTGTSSFSESVAVHAQDAEVTDPWPGGAEARRAAFDELAQMVRADRHVEVIDRAREIAREPYAAQWADSLRHVADSAEEASLYARARRIPSSALERNRDAYEDLARRFPASSQAALYVQKRDAYAQRIVDRDNARFRPRRAARQSSSCCKRCSTGKPCGNSCISRSYTCRKPPGCAC